MRKYLRSAIVIEILVLALAISFLLSFFAFGVGADRSVLNVSLMFTVLLLVAVLLFVLWRQTLERETLVRRFYISHEWIYNHEIGYAPLDRIIPDGDAYDFVTFAAEALARMSYGFEVANTPSSFEPEYIIESSAFLFHSTDEDDDEGAVVVDTWEGTLLKVDNPRDGKSSQSEVGNFSNAGELARLIEEVEAVTPLEQEVVG